MERLRRRIKIVCGLGGLVACLVGGSAYERWGRRRDHARFPQVGRSFDIGGRTLNMYCSGEGAPVVVFDSNGHTAGYRWVDIQPEVATFTRACWYDRAGYGWSDPGPSPRTFRAVATDLHALLQAGAVRPPYVLVGEGLAGFHIRVYAGLYPGEMAAAVLVNSAEVGPAGHEKGFQPGGLGGMPTKVKALGCKTVGPALLQIGLLRLSWNGQSQQPNSTTVLSIDQQEELRFLSNTPVSITGGEGCALDESLSQVRAAGNLGSLPLVVITSTRPDTRMQEEQAARNHAPGQPQLVGLSTIGRQVLVDPSNSMLTVVTQAIHEVVGSVRQGSGR